MAKYRIRINHTMAGRTYIPGEYWVNYGWVISVIPIFRITKAKILCLIRFDDNINLTKK